MKRYLTALLIIILAVIFMAGTVSAKGLSGKGVKLGLNLANWIGSDASPGAGVTKKMRVGFAGGVFLTYDLGEYFAIEPEVLYAMKGVKYDSSGSTFTEKWDYLEIPVLLKLLVPTDNNFKPFVVAGPELGFRLSAKEKAKIAGQETTIDVKDFSKSTDFGIVVGAGFNYLLTSGAITLDARYDLGLTKIIKSPAGVTEPNTKNGVITFLVGYSF